MENVENSDSDFIKSIIGETIKELHAQDTGIRFKKPETIQGWIFILSACCGAVAFLFSAVIFLNDVAKHHKSPYHEGAERLVEDVTLLHTDHNQSNEIHPTQGDIQLQILKETKPIKEDIQVIKQDIRSIETKVDILIDRQYRTGGQE